MKMKLRLGVSVLAVGLVCMSSLHAQTSPAKKAGQDRSLNAAAATPFLGQRAADKVKDVRDGGDARKADESAVEGPKGLPAPQIPAAGSQGAPPASPQPDAQAQPAAPPPPKVLNWRLKGIVGSRKGGLAVVDVGGQNPIMVRSGQQIDDNSKVVKVSRNAIVVEFDGRQLNLSPW
jgi:hypothetical protein